MKNPPKPKDAKGRRKRSDMTHQEAYSALGRFCRRVMRMCNSSEAYHRSADEIQSPPGVLVYKFEAKGSFVPDGDDVFEALRVAGGYKLPRQDEEAETIRRIKAEWAADLIRLGKEKRVLRSEVEQLKEENERLRERKPNCETCDDEGTHYGMVCYGGSPYEALVHCVDCGGAMAGQRVEE